MLAHELRRRMAAVRVAGEAIAMLRDQGLDLMPMLDLLLAEVADLDELAVEVLGDRRDRQAEAGSEPAPAAATPDVAVTVQAAARTVAVARGATVRVQAGVQAEVQASPTMLRQAIENLIDNAAAHGGRDGGEVPSGHGIGLFVVRRFLDEAGGRSWVASREGGGTLVGLRLPLRPDAEPDPLDIAVST
jgi:signal transduction histidine kinase